MAEDVKPTRKNLMSIEDRIELSERGHDTLEQKRDGLIMEFMDILDQAQDVRSDLSDDYETAQSKINMARAMEGDVAVRGAAAALKEHPEITTQSKNIMGVVVPQIESSRVKKSLDQRGYGLLGSSARIDEAADAYEELIESIILAAEVETAMKKMLEEIETTKRRVNALEFKLLPDLYENQEYIEQKLEEQEREETFRLKKIKDKKEEEEKEEREAEAEQTAETASNGAETEQTAETASNGAEKGETTATVQETVKEKAEEKTDEVKEKAEEKTDEVKERAKEKAKDVKDKLS